MRVVDSTESAYYWQSDPRHDLVEALCSYTFTFMDFLTLAKNIQNDTIIISALTMSSARYYIDVTKNVFHGNLHCSAERLIIMSYDFTTLYSKGNRNIYIQAISMPYPHDEDQSTTIVLIG